MASVKVAVRARPFNQRELEMQSAEIIKMQGNKTTITNLKVVQPGANDELGRERVKEFTFDYSYWSVDNKDPHFVDQEQVFKDLGQEVVDNAFQGYNACIFAYGQTGSGKTFTMMGSHDNEGLIPRICQELYARMKSNQNSGTTFRTEVSYLEIYNEKVKDLLKREATMHNLRVREHPKLGPYVQDLSRHLVMDYADVQELMTRGNSHRTTASTAMNDVSSRSHAIFTLNFTQATLNRDMPSETVSKVNLVDLAGSERADSTKATGQRLKEGGHINKSLVTLGSVISALAELSTSHTKKTVFIPYRDSVLTWLLKDSLGGNSKTIMIATISPAECNYGETLSTLRYANRAKNIINKPTINEDPNVKLIKELREEIARLRYKIGIDDGSTSVIEKLQENEARVKFLTDEWAEKWKETQKILKEQKTLGLRMSGQGVVLDSARPHLIGLGDGLLSTGVVLYHLKDGKTLIGTDKGHVKQDIVLSGAGIQDEHCVIELVDGCATLVPKPDSECYVDTQLVEKSTRLTQGCVVLLGSTNVFRYNDPAEVDKLKKEKERKTNFNISHLSFLSRSVSDIVKSSDSLGTNGFSTDCIPEDVAEKLEERRRELEELERKHKEADLQREKEQEAVEKELAEKREQLKQLQNETEMLKKMANEAHKRAEEEQMKLQKITDELEKHLQEQANHEKDSAARIMEMKQELTYLTNKEKEVRENTERLKYRLEQEKVYVLSKLESEQSRLYDEIKSLEMQKSDLSDKIASHTAELSRIEEDLNKRKDGWSSQRKLLEEEVELLKDELAISLGQASENWRSLLSLVPSVQLDIPLPKCTSELNQAIEDIRQQLTDAKLGQLATLQNERQNILGQIAALEEKRNILKNIENSSDDENREEVVARLRFLEQELSKLRDEEAEMSGKEDEAEEGWKHNLDSLDSLLPLVDSMVGDLDQLEGCIKDKEQEIADIDHVVLQNTSGMTKMVNEGKNLEEQLQRVQQREEDAVERQASLKASLNVVDEKIVLLAKQEEDILGVLHEKKGRLQTEISRIDSGKDSMSSSPNMDGDMSFSQSETFLCNEDLGVMTSSPIRSSLGNHEEFRQRLKELVNLEEQYSALEKELESRRRTVDSEREQEQGMIELQRVHLQELEEQERVMALIQERAQRIRENNMMRSMTYLKSPYNCGHRSGSSRSLPILPTYPHFGVEMGTAESPIRISIPSYTLRGTGSSAHIEYEVKIAVMEDCWTLFRRYKRFRELHQYMKHKYGKKLTLPYFPPRKLFGSTSERLTEERRKLLEVYLIELVNACRRDLSCPLHRSVTGLCKQHMWEFAPFFRKGCFEMSKHSTG
ncbi:kinesin-like protein KIF16B isoform X2 [Ornithodoros turicata]|uniref:kinesin-like protein KIF16B isoform X2 n=1 Tax=Ornithodoros turicata TaxID=34597 RepID=UPI003139DD7E